MSALACGLLFEDDAVELDAAPLTLVIDDHFTLSVSVIMHFDSKSLEQTSRRSNLDRAW